MAAREQLRVAHALAGVPAIRAEFGAGRLSYSQVRALTRVATPELESALLEMAQHCTAAQLDRLTRGYRKASEQLEEAREAHDRRGLDWWEDRGMLVVQARLPVAEGELVLHALRQLHDRIWGSTASAEQTDAGQTGAPDVSVGDSAEAPDLKLPADGSRAAGDAELTADNSAEAPRSPSPAATMADALAVMAERSLDQEPNGSQGADHRQLIVHVDLETLAGDAPGRCETGDGRSVAPETARRLGCDAALVPVRRRGGRPLSVGRRTRVIPPHIRRALDARDRGCRFPGCEKRDYLDGHHIEHWAHGGETSEANLVLLCRHHHTLVHEGGYGVIRRGDGRLAFFRSDGRRIADAPRCVGGRTDGVIDANRRAGVPVGPDTAVTGWQGDRLDLPLATHLLCEIRARR